MVLDSAARFLFHSVQCSDKTKHCIAGNITARKVLFSTLFSLRVPAKVKIELRRKQVKNFCCLLFLSNGTPMFRVGDEFLNTQFGNNNPYNQDNEIGWLESTPI